MKREHFKFGHSLDGRGVLSSKAKTADLQLAIFFLFFSRDYTHNIFLWRSFPFSSSQTLVAPRCHSPGYFLI